MPYSVTEFDVVEDGMIAPPEVDQCVVTVDQEREKPVPVGEFQVRGTPTGQRM
nr:hypothetical protein [Nocardia miyunensis]